MREDERPAERIEDMAAEYLAAIADAGFTGPLVLGGWSMGGVVAFEMARQLEAGDGRTVPVVMIDSYAPDPADPHPPTPTTLQAAGPYEDGSADGDAAAQAHLIAAFAADFERTTDIDLGVRAEDLIALPYADQPAHLLARAQRAGALDENDGPDFVDRLLGLYRANRTALDRYRPATGHHGPLLLLSAADSGADGSAVPAEASRGWQHWSTTGLVVRTVPGDHYSVLHTDHLDRLANRLRSHTLTGASR
ncbi:MULTISPECIES: alpha/beta fold hydrolase [unclassified Streptomyces]